MFEPGSDVKSSVRRTTKTKSAERETQNVAHVHLEAETRPRGPREVEELTLGLIVLQFWSDTF